MQDRTVGIVGLGLLGGALAARLVERGFRVVGFDFDEARRSAATEAGVEIAPSSADVVGRCDVALLSLPNGDVTAALLAEVMPHLRPGQTIVETTTAAPEQMQAHAALLAARGASFVEAEIAGSSAQARRGEVLVFTAGKEADVERVRPVLEAFACETHYAGRSGNAARWKLVHNLILGLHRAVLAEGLALAEAQGLDAAKLLEVLKRSPAASAVMTTKGPKMLARDFAPQATVRQHLKDVRLILTTAAECGSPAPLSELHARLLEEVVERGFSEADNSAIFRAFSRK